MQHNDYLWCAGIALASIDTTDPHLAEVARIGPQLLHPHHPPTSTFVEIVVTLLAASTVRAVQCAVAQASARNTPGSAAAYRVPMMICSAHRALVRITRPPHDDTILQRQCAAILRVARADILAITPMLLRARIDRQITTALHGVTTGTWAHDLQTIYAPLALAFTASSAHSARIEQAADSPARAHALSSAAAAVTATDTPAAQRAARICTAAAACATLPGTPVVRDTGVHHHADQRQAA